MPGFLQYLFPTRASLMLDVVFLAMFLVVPTLAVSIQLAKRKQYTLHKITQTVLGAVLLVAVLAFEIDMRFYTQWRALAEPSPYYANGLVSQSLMLHLCFAVPTLVLWILVTARALMNYPNPPRPAAESKFHLFWGKVAGLGMVGTAVTGWLFYYLAFVA
ncbi:MAG: DUF420 domain-containing protein [Pirellulales bacterium]|nr:DUF420 domain-containing protein [Pirellulales bacterium]